MLVKLATSNFFCDIYYMADNSNNSDMAVASKPKKTSKSHQQPQSECTVCHELITEPTERKEGHLSIFCEGKCQAKLHKGCAGLSKQDFEFYSTSKTPYYCLHCTNKAQQQEI